MASYCPRQGDVVWLSFDPQAGHEQAGNRPALVISPDAYNRKTNLVLCCPITNQQKGYPFEVKIPQGIQVSGVVLSDQVKCLDWKARKAKFCCRLTPETFSEVVGKLSTLINKSL